MEHQNSHERNLLDKESIPSAETGVVDINTITHIKRMLDENKNEGRKKLLSSSGKQPREGQD